MALRPINVVIADDHPIVREGLVGTLSAHPQFHVVATVASCQALLHVIQDTPVDIVILDIGGMGGSPLTVVERLTREQPQLAILVFSSNVDLAPELLQAGAKGYVVKEELSAQLIAAIQLVYRGQTFVSPAAQDYLLRCTVQAAHHRLTPQELSVLKLLAQGLGTEAIADHLGIDPRTVHNYILRLLQKTGYDQRTQLAF